MTTMEQKLNAYSSQKPLTLSNREIDARALLTCASRLKEVLDAKGADMKAHAAAIRLNQQLWTIFQVALCDQENPLPHDLKINLLGLSRYIDRVSFRLITSFIPDQLTSLIDINKIIAAGLMRKVPEVEKQPSVAPTSAPAVVSVMTTI